MLYRVCLGHLTCDGYQVIGEFSSKDEANHYARLTKENNESCDVFVIYPSGRRIHIKAQQRNAE